MSRPDPRERDFLRALLLSYADTIDSTQAVVLYGNDDTPHSHNFGWAKWKRRRGPLLY